MSYKPSSRRHYEIDEPELNLNPMMDMFGVLIPALLMMTAVVEINCINVSAPSIGSGGSSSQQPSNEIPLNLTVAVNDAGYKIQSAVPGAFAEIPGASGPMSNEIALPLVRRDVLCSRYRETVPPPRDRNKSEPPCGKDKAAALKKRSFWIYDRPALSEKALAIKNKYPHEIRIIIQPSPDVEYESIVDVMDATRDVRLPSGELQVLFDEVVMSPGT
jgi:biopolymer transport protein ExbD